jgi:DNA helicase-2/ATP-dependent DNA helicase PcrA
MQPKLQETFKTLNQRQLEAVKAIEGPVTVFAGPGTGKTQILATRIGRILQETDTNPDQIICLTFTDAGAVAMRKRLLKFIGPDAYRIFISTFHGFCTHIIQENPEQFGFREMEPISELESHEILADIIASLDPQNPIKRLTGDVHYEISRLLSLFSNMKRENWDPDHIERHIGEYIQSLPERPEFIYQRNGKDFKKGDLKQKDYDQAIRRMETLRAAVHLYQPYQRAMNRMGRFDYDDMILWVLEAFKKDKDLLLRYQEQFLYILVDEYQDTNGSQNEIVNLLSSYFEIPNVFVVGDDDQSIYRFQGANMENIHEFMDRYQNHLTPVVLTENYRSSQAILDMARSLIDRNESRLIRGDQKKLHAANAEVADLGQPPQLLRYPNDYHEIAGVVDKIIELHHSGVAYEEMAVIYSQHKFSENLVRLMRFNNIPLSIKFEEDCLKMPLIGQLLSLIEFLYNEYKKPGKGEGLVYQIMNYNFFGLDPRKLQEDMMAFDRVRKQDTYLLQFLADQNPHSEQGDLFNQNGPANRFEDSASLARAMLNWTKAVEEHTVASYFQHIIHHSGLLAYVLRHPNRSDHLEELNTFFAFVKSEQSRKKDLDLGSFLETIELMRAQGIRVPVHKAMKTESGVNLLSAHGSKGLEFEHVFIIQAHSKAWESQRSGGNAYTLPDNLLLSIDPKLNDIEEKRRLFYVAMTRAKKGLYISYPEEDDRQKQNQPSLFMAECMQFLDKSEADPAQGSDEQMLKIFEAILSKQGKPVIPLYDEPKVDKMLENYTLSVTHMNIYLRCPVSFFFSYILKIPQAKFPAMEFGSAVHSSLDRFFKKAAEEGKVPPLEFLMEEFYKGLAYRKDGFTEKEYKRRKEYGEQFLPLYYRKYQSTWNTTVLTEKGFTNINIGEVPVKGFVDKVELNGKDAVLVDYKTGQFKNTLSRSSFNRPGEKVRSKAKHHVEEFGGDYWRQAVFYKILVSEDRNTEWQVAKVEFDFVEPDSDTGDFHKQGIEITEEDQSVVRDQIQRVYKGIMNKEFDKGCGQDDCDWCNFVKSDFTIPSFKVEIEEQE